jgi:hypothetical protein
MSGSSRAAKLSTRDIDYPSLFVFFFLFLKSDPSKLISSLSYYLDFSSFLDLFLTASALGLWLTVSLLLIFQDNIINLLILELKNLTCFKNITEFI